MDRRPSNRSSPTATRTDSTPVLVGSGVREDTVGDVLAVADGAIVGTALKEGGETTAPSTPTGWRRSSRGRTRSGKASVRVR